MTTTALGTVLHRLRCRVLLEDEAEVPDGALLESFVTCRDEVAFEALLRRHGAMVLSVCRRILGNESDAEDAFQATFLVLIRKAASIRPRGMVGNWLYGVAHTTALKARAMTSKRLARERAAAERPRTQASPGIWEHLQGLLDKELTALPDHYRAAIVLCDLEGKSIKQAAAQLGCPPGAIGTRLARGRVLLARRLARHGLTLSGGALATLISQNLAAAVLPPHLVHVTLKTAAALCAAGPAAGLISAKVASLTEGVLGTMLISKLKIASIVLLGTMLLAFGTTTVGLGTAQEKGSKKAKVIEVDLSKLPPDLAKRLLEFTGAKGAKEGEEDEKKPVLLAAPPGQKPVATVLGPKAFRDGDVVEITDVRATSPKLELGDAVTVRGRVRLASQDQARLCLYLTQTEGDGLEESDRSQEVQVKRGLCEFELKATIKHRGVLHLTFYDRSGQPFGGVYFGTEAQMKQIEGWSVDYYLAPAKD